MASARSWPRSSQAQWVSAKSWERGGVFNVNRTGKPDHCFSLAGLTPKKVQSEMDALSKMTTPGPTTPEGEGTPKTTGGTG